MDERQSTEALTLSYIWYIFRTMDAERTIADIESLERLLDLPDPRPLQSTDISAANQRHDQNLATSPWFKLWRDFGVCCRPEPLIGDR